MGEWKPIESGPKDRTIVEVIDIDDAISRGYYEPMPGWKYWCFADQHGLYAGKAYGLKAWRPLPAPPEKE